MRTVSRLGLVVSAAMLLGCSSQDVPQAHKGRMFDKTGALAFYSGGRGFEGPILGPGTYYTGAYPEIRMVDCGQRTVKESLTALTKDGVQFSMDIYVRYSANCDDEKAVEKILATLSPSGEASAPTKTDKGAATPVGTNSVENDAVEPFPLLTITGRQLYSTYIRPALGEATREGISPYIANEVNGKRDEIFEKIKEKFNEYVAKIDSKLIIIYSMNLSNLNFPDELVHANTDRATQAVLKDKAIAERERVQAEIETAKMRLQLVTNEAQNEAAKIDTVGAALHRNPEYYLRDVYFFAADKGGSVVLPTNPNVILQMTPHVPGK